MVSCFFLVSYYLKNNTAHPQKSMPKHSSGSRKLRASWFTRDRKKHVKVMERWMNQNKRNPFKKKSGCSLLSRTTLLKTFFFNILPIHSYRQLCFGLPCTISTRYINVFGCTLQNEKALTRKAIFTRRSYYPKAATRKLKVPKNTTLRDYRGILWRVILRIFFL